MRVDQTAFVENILSLPTMSNILQTFPQQQQPKASPTEESEASLCQGGPDKVTVKLTEENNPKENGKEEQNPKIGIPVTRDTGPLKKTLIYANHSLLIYWFVMSNVTPIVHYNTNLAVFNYIHVENTLSQATLRAETSDTTGTAKTYATGEVDNEELKSKPNDHYKFEKPNKNKTNCIKNSNKKKVQFVNKNAKTTKSKTNKTVKNR